jgi:hypothetical protein
MRIIIEFLIRWLTSCSSSQNEKYRRNCEETVKLREKR